MEDKEKESAPKKKRVRVKKAPQPKKTKKPINKFHILVDTREKTPWNFRASEYCSGSTTGKVEHGDYSILGMEHLIFLERKASPSEIAQNVLEKRFDKLLLNAEKYRYKFIDCEFSFEKLLNYPYGNGLPSSVVKRIKLRGSFLLSRLQHYCLEHNINIVFCDNKSYAQQYTLSLFKKIAEREGI